MFTARDLLYKALDYDGVWNISKRMLNSKPSQLRQLQIEKLLLGFGISKTNEKPQSRIDGKYIIESIYISGQSKQMNRSEYLKKLTDFKYFTTGEFISDASPEKYQHLIDQIISTSKSIFPEQSEIIDKKPLNLVSLFKYLYNFRLTVYLMIEFDFSKKRIKLFSTEDDYALYLRKKFTTSMNAGLLEIDEMLCTLIDPENKTLKEDEINYPSDDLKSLDEEWENNEH
jgi:hypothetical protein